jgi:cysteine desulfuration protein SufE
VTDSLSLQDLMEEYTFHPPKSVERYQMLIELGDRLEPMPDALKTAATKVPGCASSVWLYPPPSASGGLLHFLADSNSAFTKGVVALVLATVQDRSAKEILQTDIPELLAPFGLSRDFTADRTRGVPNMIAKIKDTARRLAA